MTALDTVRREMWESYQAHLGEGCIDRRLLPRWYGLLERESARDNADDDAREEGEERDGA